MSDREDSSVIRQLRLTATFVLSVAWGLASVCAAQNLPGPVDVPTAPRAAPRSPGGKHLPDMTGSDSDRAPQISMAGDMTFPDETLVLCGYNLGDATLKVWAEGGLTDLAAVKTAHDRMLTVLPDTLPASTMLIWPVKDGLAGSPVRMNAATA